MIRYKTLTITGSAAEALAEHPIELFVHRDAGTDAGHHVFLGDAVRPDFTDLRITDAAGAGLDFWIRDIAGGVATVWIRVPRIPVLDGALRARATVRGQSSGSRHSHKRSAAGTERLP